MLRSVRLRILLGTGVYFLLILICTRTLSYYQTKNLITTVFEGQLKNRLLYLQTLEETAPDLLSLELPKTEIPPPVNPPKKGVFQLPVASIWNYPIEIFWGIQDHDGKIVDSRGLPEEISPTLFKSAKGKDYWEGELGTDRYRIFFSKDSQARILFVGGSLTSVSYPVNQLLFFNLGIAAFTITSLLAGLWFILGRMLIPIKRISKTAEIIRQGDMGARIQMEGIDEEVREMALSLNLMLDKLEKSHENQARFISDFSHELQTPLGVILMKSEMALENDLPLEEHQAIHQDCKNLASRMGRLAGDLLELAQSETPSSQANHWISLEALFDEAVIEIEPLALEKNIKIEVRCPSLQVWGHGHQLHRVLVNLLSNAVKFGPAKSTVFLTAENSEGKIIIRVIDSGPGVPQKDNSRLFQRFFRTKSPHSPNNKPGNGLGLAISKNIVEHHRGTLRYERTNSGLTVFEVSLPETKEV